MQLLYIDVSLMHVCYRKHVMITIRFWYFRKNN